MFNINIERFSMSANVQKGVGGEPCHASYADIQILLFNRLSKRFEYTKCKASELISQQNRINY